MDIRRFATPVLLVILFSLSLLAISCQAPEETASLESGETADEDPDETIGEDIGGDEPTDSSDDPGDADDPDPDAEGSTAGPEVACDGRLVDGVTVLFSNYFDDGSPANEVGLYDGSDVAAGFLGPSWYNGVDEGRVSVVEANDTVGSCHVLQVLYPQGAYGSTNSGAQWQLDLGSVYEELSASYWVRFPQDFEFVKGGKLPGLCGGECNTSGEKPTGVDGWSARIMWREDGRIVQYVYYPDQPGDYGVDFPWSGAGSDSSFSPGLWHHVETRIKLNTVGVSDGTIESWLDGVLVLNAAGLRFRDVSRLGIDVFYFSTFYGGSDETWAPPSDQSVEFDGLVISTQWVGMY